MKKRIIILMLVIISIVSVLVFTDFNLNFLFSKKDANEDTLTTFVEKYRNLKSDAERKNICEGTYSEFIYYNNDTHSCIEFSEASNENIIGSYASYVKYQHQVVDISKSTKEFISSHGKVSYTEYIVISKYKITDTSSYQSFTGKFYYVEYNGKTYYSYENVPVRWSIFNS